MLCRIQRTPEPLEAFLKYENEVFNGKQERESIICVKLIEKSVPHDHHLSSLGKPCDARKILLSQTSHS